MRERQARRDEAAGRRVRDKYNESLLAKLLLAVDETAFLLDVSKRRVFELIKNGELDTVLLGPQTRRVTRLSIDALISRKVAELRGEQVPAGAQAAPEAAA
jgi:excisionase family DNA binding protein